MDTPKPIFSADSPASDKKDVSKTTEAPKETDKK